MNSLKVPENGLLLAGSGSGSESAIPQQAFQLTLNSSVIEAMIRSARNGEEMRLDLGKSPILHYGSARHRISPPIESRPYDLYLTKPFESSRRAERIPEASSLFEKPKKTTMPANSQNEPESKPKTSISSKGSTSSGLDSDREVLQNGLAAHDAARERARVIGKLPDAKKAAPKPKAKLLSNYNANPRSLPTSPGLNASRSPLSNPTLSASQQAMSRAKEQRVTLIHELAAGDQSIDRLSEKWGGKQSEFEPILKKVAEFNPEADRWSMKKAYWKELDVWNYDYDTQDERQSAIDNAVRQYDKQRLSANEPEWQKLLPKEERGKGKCLSRLQAKLAKEPPPPVPPAPKIKIQKAEDGFTSGDAVDSDKPKAGGEKMARSASNPLPLKNKKAASGRDAPAKSLLNNPKPKAAAQRLSPTKPKNAAGVSKTHGGGRVLSQAIIENSDSSGDEAPAPKPKAKPKVKDTVVVASRPLVKAPVAKPPPAKRPREDDDSSSSSGIPLSKRIKAKQALPAPRLKHRPSDASQQSRGTGTSTSFKSKNTSPTKSSPLASSPPTNASDLEHEAPPVVKKKRKLPIERESKPVPPKRRVVDHVSVEVIQKANKFKSYYQKYEALHHEISALDNPPDEKLADLLDMRDRLELMKREIYREYSPGRD